LKTKSLDRKKMQEGKQNQKSLDIWNLGAHKVHRLTARRSLGTFGLSIVAQMGDEISSMLII
jgi:hypothetical protein